MNSSTKFIFLYFNLCLFVYFSGLVTESASSNEKFDPETLYDLAEELTAEFSPLSATARISPANSPREKAPTKAVRPTLPPASASKPLAAPDSQPLEKSLSSEPTSAAPDLQPSSTPPSPSAHEPSPSLPSSANHDPLHLQNHTDEIVVKTGRGKFSDGSRSKDALSDASAGAASGSASDSTSSSVDQAPPDTQPQQAPKTQKSFHHHHNVSHYKEGPYQHKRKHRSKLGDDTGSLHIDYLFQWIAISLCSELRFVLEHSAQVFADQAK